jgi:hypothetical protein
LLTLFWFSIDIGSNCFIVYGAKDTIMLRE